MKIRAIICIAAIFAAASSSAATLSVFIEQLRGTFIVGEEVEVMVVLKTPAPFKGGAGRFLITETGVTEPVSETSFKVPRIKESGRHVELFRFDTTALKPGDYTVRARVGALESNVYSIVIAGRARPTNFGIVDVAWWPQSASAYPGFGFKPFQTANVNMVIDSGTGNATASTYNVMGVGWTSAKNKVAGMKWAADLSKPVVELHPERHRSGYALAEDGALRNGVNRLWRPFHITDRSWGGSLEENNHGNQTAKRIMQHTWTRRRYLSYLGICFNDDPHNNFGPWFSSPQVWSHLHPQDGARIFPKYDVLERRNGKWLFKGSILNVPLKHSSGRFRGSVTVPFEPVAAFMVVYQDDYSWIYINGNMAKGWGAGWSRAHEFSLKGDLHKGKNVIATETYNVTGPGYFAATIRAVDKKGKTHTWYTDRSWLFKYADEANDWGRKYNGAPAAPAWAAVRYDDSDWAPASLFGKVDKDGRNTVAVPTLTPQMDMAAGRNQRMMRLWQGAEEFGKFYRVVSDQLHDMDPGMKTTTNHGLFWGPGIGEWTPTQYRALDFGISVLYTDQGESPLSDCLDADQFQRGMRPGTSMWVPLSNFWTRNNIIVRGVRTLGRKVGGLGYFNGGGGIHSADGWRTNAGEGEARHGRRYQMETLNIILQTYGDLFHGLQEDDKVAWLGNWTEETGGPYSWGRPHGFYNMEEAHYTMMRSHFPGNIVTERETLEGKLIRDGYEALFISARYVPLPEDVMDEIERFIDNGGKVVATDCAPVVHNLPGVIRVRDTMTNGFVRHNSPPWDTHNEFIQPERAFKRYGAEFKKKMGSVVTPFVASESMWVTFSTQKYGKAKYVFAVNDLWPPFYNEKRKWRTNQWEKDKYGSLTPMSPRMMYTMPARHTLSFSKTDGALPEGFVVYDLFAQKQLELNEVGDRRALDIFFVNRPARILVCLPKPIDKLSLAVSPVVNPGELLRTKIRVLDADGEPIDALFPVEVEIIDPAGVVRYHLWRTGGPDTEKHYKIALNDMPGTWTFRARELVSGKVSEMTFSVARDPAVTVRVTREQGKAIVIDEYAVWKLMTRNQVEGPIYIILSPKQERFRPLAEKLKTALEASGSMAEIKVYDPKHVQDTPSDNGPYTSLKNGGFTSHSGVIRGMGTYNLPVRMMRNAIVFATPATSGNDAANLWYAYGKTPNYPPPTWGLIQYQWGSYILNYDAVQLFAHDDAGMANAVDKLITIAKRKMMERPPTARRSISAEGIVVGDDILAVRLKPASAAPSSDGQVQSERQEDILAHRFGVPIGTAAISPNGKYIAVGSDGYGENLYVFNRDGTVRWKTKVGVLNVRFLTFSKDSRRLQCSSNVFPYLRKNNNTFIVENTCVYNVKTGKREQFLYGKQDPLDVETVARENENGDKKAQQWIKEGNMLMRMEDGVAEWSYTIKSGQLVRAADVSDNGKWVILNAWNPHKEFWFHGKPILVFLDGETGRELWRKDTAGIKPGHNKVTVLDGGAVILQDGDAQGRPMFNILRPSDGKNVYSHTGLPGSQGLPFTLAPDSSWIFLASGGILPDLRRKYIGVERPDMVIRFKEEIESKEWTPDKKRLLVSTWDGKVTMLDMRKWTRLWETEIPGGPHATYSPDRKHILVTTYVGTVHYLDAADGRVLWTYDLNEAEMVPDLYERIVKWLDDNTREALAAEHEINVRPDKAKSEAYLYSVPPR